MFSCVSTLYQAERDISGKYKQYRRIEHPSRVASLICHVQSVEKCPNGRTLRSLVTGLLDAYHPGDVGKGHRPSRFRGARVLQWHVCGRRK